MLDPLPHFGGWLNVAHFHSLNSIFLNYGYGVEYFSTYVLIWHSVYRNISSILTELTLLCEVVSQCFTGLNKFKIHEHNILKKCSYLVNYEKRTQ